MNKLILTLAACASLSVSAFAQEPAKSDFGLIGKRYAGGDVNYTDYRDVDLSGLGLGLSVNLPVYSNIDLNFGYGFSNLDSDNNSDTTGHVIGGEALFYSKDSSAFTPYLAAGLASQWLDVDNGDNSSDLVWHARVGAEFPIAGKTSGDIGVGFRDTFDSGDEGQTIIYGEIHHAFTDKITGVVGLSSIENDAIVLSAGVRFRF